MDLLKGVKTWRQRYGIQRTRQGWKCGEWELEERDSKI